jgi:hypothetical protein
MTRNDSIIASASFTGAEIAKTLAITIGYRKGICQALLTAEGAERVRQLVRLDEANKELKRLLNIY